MILVSFSPRRHDSRIAANATLDYVGPMMKNTKNTLSQPSSLSRPSLPRRDFVSTAIATATIGATVGAVSLPSMAMADETLEQALASRYLGEMDAPVQVAEYYSMTCSHCAAFHNNVFPMVKSKLIDTGLVRFEMRAFPLDGLALRAHALARSLPESKFFPMIKTLLAQQPSWSRAQDPLQALMRIARFAGVSEDEFNNIMRNRELLEGIVDQRQRGVDKWNISSTPSFVVNDDEVLAGNMSYEDFAGHLSAFGA